jgi:hypothetical protein
MTKCQHCEDDYLDKYYDMPIGTYLLDEDNQVWFKGKQGPYAWTYHTFHDSGGYSPSSFAGRVREMSVEPLPLSKREIVADLLMGKTLPIHLNTALECADKIIAAIEE